MPSVLTEVLKRLDCPLAMGSPAVQTVEKSATADPTPQANLADSFLSAACKGDIAELEDLACARGRELGLSGGDISSSLGAIWGTSFQVARRLLAVLEDEPEERETALGEWCRLAELAATSLVHAYNVAREGLAAKEREELLWQAAHDGLTGLYNQRFLNARLDEELARAERHGHHLSLLMLDVDYFKLYNDTAGHLMGNDVLRGLATAVDGAVRRSDIVARFGGEEYVVVLPETGSAGALVVAERIRGTVEGLVFPGMERQPLGRVTVSLGCATYPGDGTTGLELIRAADTALYEAKRLGRNRVCVCRQKQEGEGESVG